MKPCLKRLFFLVFHIVTILKIADENPKAISVVNYFIYMYLSVVQHDYRDMKRTQFLPLCMIILGFVSGNLLSQNSTMFKIDPDRTIATVDPNI